LDDPDLTLPPRHRAGLESVARAGFRLRKLVESLLDFSRVEASETKLELEPVDLAALTAELGGMFRSVIEEAGLEYDIDIDTFTDVVEVDREMWAKIVLNLLSNAVKFTQHGSIRLSLHTDEDMIVLAVQDTGIGIPAGQLSKVFERFTQVSGRSGRSAEGSGIGLALVAALAAAHGGAAAVESEVGLGSTFCVRVPLVRSERPEAPVAAIPTADPVMQAYGVEAAAWLRGAEPSGLRDYDPDGERQVLLVEDNADMRNYLESELVDDGWMVRCAGDVESALNADPMPDIVVSDVMLPGRSGLDLVRLLRADSRLRRIPVILLSARSGPDAATEGLELGADDYVVKPFDSRELLARVRVHYELARLHEYELTRAEDKAANLGRALASNRRIGIAVGVLMTRDLLTAEEAFSQLRDASQRLNRKLYEIADDVVLTGMLPVG
jgi:DNA-binding response OmpR family regulator